ncbi:MULTISPECIES: hypothetical protein [Chryseobacterium]|jgi:hypothetical protein|uniref:DUF1990 domain-containing protein n=1 Tax=Chryseobacterium geocarposphaerae TaxID=1416776 RepID=A0ABU1L923_9FLAO|nr:MULTISPECIES: hypothetical protein [Chryseobacterium]MDR6403214.1 hypothetical protein [Chryseobacterium geocarposphaerae]MDR6696769.1 hypothetical protein [Chryseobacterium ginsenosidimutans]
MRWYRLFLKLPNFATRFRQLNSLIYTSGNRGFPPMRGLRSAWHYLDWEYDKEYHEYKIIEEAGSAYDFTAQELYDYLKSGINKTVPFSVIGKDNIVFAERENGGWTTAGMGGPVQTTHNDETLEMINFAGGTHFFAGGYVKIKVFEKNDKIYIKVKGYGTNNFAGFNKWFGKRLFQNVINSNIAEYKKLIAKRPKQQEYLKE